MNRAGDTGHGQRDAGHSFNLVFLWLAVWRRLRSHRVHKGPRWHGLVFLGLFFGPLAVLVVAAVSNENPPAEPVTEAAASAVVASVAPTGVADELSKLADLLDRGHLSSDEFEAQKKKLLT